MTALPTTTGTMTFVFTDLEGSTRLWEHFPAAMQAALPRHDSILQASVQSFGGHIVKTTGDGVMAVFGTAPPAVAACLAAQRELGAADWADTGPLRVRMGVHSGQADARANDYFGPTVNRTARIMAAGHGGQVLLSATAGALVQSDLPAGASLIDLGEHRLKDLDRPEHVFQLRHADLIQSFPPLATVRQATADIPARVAELIGREADLRQIKELLADPLIRLLTLAGPGGTGKTTLAVRVAEDLEASYGDGAAFVDLSSVRDANSVLAAIARAVGLNDAVERPLLEELSESLAGREMLLVLDNLEQVAAVGPQIVDLLRDCPSITVLATSRQALHVRLERLMHVPPLGLPPARSGDESAADVAAFDAVKLFVDRARAVRPDFELTDTNAAVVADICRRLDGLPLAIELAAARLQLFSPEVLRDRLGDRLGLLRSGPRDLPERQQTLRATMDWSYELLTADERLLFEMLGVFADADVAAIEEVARRVGPVDGLSMDTIDALASLVEKSLLRQVEVAGGEPRITMLETVREFARDRLAQRPSLASRAAEAHAAYYSALAGGLRSDLGGNRRQAALETLAAESANVRLAWSHWVAARDLRELNGLVGPLMTLDDDRGWYLNTVEMTTDMLAVLEDTPPSPERIGQEIALRTSLARALLATRGVTKEVEEALNQALELFESGADTRQQYSVLRGLASLYLFRGQIDQAAQIGHEILALGEREDDFQLKIDGQLLIGSVQVTSADVIGGLDRLERTIAMFEAHEPDRVRTVRIGADPRVPCYTTAAIGEQLVGQADRALRNADAALALARRLEHPFTSAYALFHAGLVRHFMRDEPAAHDLALNLLEVAQEHGFRIWIATGRVLLGASRVAMGSSADGLADIGSGIALYQDLRSPPIFWPFLMWVEAAAKHAAGMHADALVQIDAAVEMLSSPPPGGALLPEMLVVKGDILVAMHKADDTLLDDAQRAYQRAFERADELGIRRSQLRAAMGSARLAHARGADRAAVAQLAAVYDTITQGFETADMIEARALIASLHG